jgi:hypothetical protein
VYARLGRHPNATRLPTTTIVLYTIMDESREDIPRISIDSLRDWHRIKANFTEAVFEQFDQRLRRNGLESERASLVPHIQQVLVGIVIPDRHSLTAYLFQFIDTTFEKAKSNVRINGKKFEDLKAEDDGTFLVRVCTLLNAIWIQTGRSSLLMRLWIVRRGPYIINACNGTSSWRPNVENARRKS